MALSDDKALMRILRCHRLAMENVASYQGRKNADEVRAAEAKSIAEDAEI